MSTVVTDMKSRAVSVILTVLNEGDGIADLLDALLNQSRQPDEIVVVDGGSHDGTVELLGRYAGKHDRIRYFVEPGVNIARGRNLAIERAAGQIIAVTDGGCRPTADWLAELVRPLMDDRAIGAVAGAFTIDWQSRFEFYSGLLCTPKDSGEEETRLFYGRSSAFRKEAWDAAGGYPEWLYTAEDTLFAMRVRQLGFRIAHAPGGIVHWRPRPTLRKLAKMFFLYGRGNGRIDVGSMAGTLYHLRNHLLWFTPFVGGFIFPPLWLMTLAVLAYLYAIMVVPVLREVRVTIPDRDREWYVPLIVMTRNIATNIGYLLGTYEYRRKHPFRQRLREYLPSC